ncbi:zinc transporter ZIP1-like isoform X1 [Artemia franciscana]|uniref:zinc transporter ZIP1-like isoform X1 n=1 Tax=Artemia franciscana TaxID=6661 RepID=UPI0032DA0ACC
MACKLHKEEKKEMSANKEDTSGITEAKIASICILAIVSLICGFIPLWIVKRFGATNKAMSRTANSILSGMLCFGAGILMATALLHLLPEVRNGLNALIECNVIQTNLPLAEIVISAGFFMVYLVEEIIHVFTDRYVTNKTAELNRVNSSKGQDSRDEETNEKKQTDSNDNKSSGKLNSGHIESGSNSSESISYINSVSEDSHEPISISHHHSHHSSHLHGIPLEGDDSLEATIRGLLIIVALCLHEIFEGMAIGLEDETSGVWQIFTAAASHKFVIIFCIGLELAITRIRLAVYIIYVTIFSLISSVGIGIGWGIYSLQTEAEDPGLQVAINVLEGLCAGTLVYVAFFEILERERTKDISRLLQLTLTIVGFMAMLGLEALALSRESQVFNLLEEAVCQKKLNVDAENLFSSGIAAV